MDMKKILIVSLVIIAIFSTLSIASATDTTILGEKFNIPDGYSQDSSNSGTLDFNSYGAIAKQGSSLMVYDESNENSHSFSVTSGLISKESGEYQTFTNDDGDNISIYVYKLGGGGKIQIQPNDGDEADIINGHSGFYNSDEKSFIYQDDENSCIIKIFADKDTLEDII